LRVRTIPTYRVYRLYDKQAANTFTIDILSSQQSVFNQVTTIT